MGATAGKWRTARMITLTRANGVNGNSNGKARNGFL